MVFAFSHPVETFPVSILKPVLRNDDSDINGMIGYTFEQTSLTEILEEVLEGLQPLPDKSKAVIHRSQLPVCQVDPSQIRSLFQNLIANALKYNNSPEPLVRIGCRDMGPEYLLSVKDNGIGIPNEFHDRIFMIFQRLHTRIDCLTYHFVVSFSHLHEHLTFTLRTQPWPFAPNSV